jgi:galactitol-specific phosphotransferase system IIB component
MKMKFYCSTKKFEGKQEAHAIASKLERAAFLHVCIARLANELQDDPKEVKAALRKEFDKESIDHEKAVDELRGLRRKGVETPVQLTWRIEKLMGKAYPELCASTHESAKKTKEQMLYMTPFWELLTTQGVKR